MKLKLAVLAAGHMLIVLDATIVNVALNAVAEGLGFDAGGLQWIVTAYTLAFGGFLLVGGRLADRYGRRQMFVVGSVLFATGALVAAIAPSGPVLIAGRALQGLGGAVLVPAALALLTVVFAEGPPRDRALGVWAGVGASGMAVGLILGGVLTQALSWRWIFWLSVVIGGAAALCARVVLPESRNPQAGRFDLAGAVLATSGLVVLVYALVRTTDVGWGSAQTLLMIVLAAALLAAFARLETVRTDALLPVSLLRRPSVLGADLVGMLFGAAVYALFYFVSLFMGGLLAYSAVRIGLAFLPMAGAVTFGAWLAGRLLGRLTERSLVVTGTLLASGGLASLTRITPDAAYAGTVLPALVGVGLGMGLAFVAITSAAVGGVPPRHSGVASGLLNVGQQVGGAIGLALLTVVSAGRTAALTPTGQPPAPPAIAEGWSLGFAVATGLMLLASAVGVTTMGGRTPALLPAPSTGNRKETPCPTARA